LFPRELRIRDYYASENHEVEDQVLSALFPREFSTGGTFRFCRHCFQGSWGSEIAILRQIMKFCRELRIRDGRVTYMPGASLDFGVASHPSGTEQLYFAFRSISICTCRSRQSQVP
jgi:hypothetical protein